MPPQIRLKTGLNDYSGEFTCSRCRKRFKNKPHQEKEISLFTRLEIDGKIMDFPICPSCVKKVRLFETRTVIVEDNKSHPIGIA